MLFSSEHHVPTHGSRSSTSAQANHDSHHLEWCVSLTCSTKVQASHHVNRHLNYLMYLSDISICCLCQLYAYLTWNGYISSDQPRFISSSLKWLSVISLWYTIHGVIILSASHCVVIELPHCVCAGKHYFLLLDSFTVIVQLVVIICLVQIYWQAYNCVANHACQCGLKSTWFWATLSGVELSSMQVIINW